MAKTYTAFDSNKGNSGEGLKDLVNLAQTYFEDLAEGCEHFNGYGGCKKLTTDGPAESCGILSCPLGKG